MAKPFVARDSPRYMQYTRTHDAEPRPLRPEDLITSMRESLRAAKTDDDTGQDLKTEILKLRSFRTSQSSSILKPRASLQRSSVHHSWADADLRQLMRAYFSRDEEIPLKDFFAALEFEFPVVFERVKPRDLLGTSLAEDSSPHTLSVAKLEDFSRRGFKDALDRLVDERAEIKSVNQEIVEELESLKLLLEEQAEAQRVKAEELEEWERQLKDKERTLKTTLGKHADMLVDQGLKRLQVHQDQLQRRYELQDSRLQESLRPRLAESVQEQSSTKEKSKGLKRALVRCRQEMTKDKLAKVNAENISIRSHNARLVKQIAEVSAKSSAFDAKAKQLHQAESELQECVKASQSSQGVYEMLVQALQGSLALLSGLRLEEFRDLSEARRLFGRLVELVLSVKDVSLTPWLVKAVSLLSTLGAKDHGGFPSKSLEVSEESTTRMLDETAKSDHPPLKQFFRDTRVQKALCKELLRQPRSLGVVWAVLVLTDDAAQMKEVLTSLKDCIETGAELTVLAQSDWGEKLLALFKAHSADTKCLASEVLLCMSIYCPELLITPLSSPSLAEVVETAVQDSSLFNHSHDIEENLIVLLSKLLLSNPSAPSIVPSIRGTLESRRSQLPEESFLQKNLCAILLLSP